MFLFLRLMTTPLSGMSTKQRGGSTRRPCVSAPRALVIRAVGSGQRVEHDGFTFTSPGGGMDACKEPTGEHTAVVR